MSVKLKVKTDTKIIAVRFQNGRVQENVSEGVKLQSFVLPETDKQMLVVEVNNATYVGNNFDHPKLCNYYVAVRSKKTGKMRVYGSSLCNLKQYDEETVERERVHLQQKYEASLQKSKKDQADQLTGAFGAAWKKRAVKARLKQEETSAAQGDAVMASTDYVLSQGDAQTTSGMNNDEVDGGFCGPPCNKDAEHAEEVYNIDSIISPLEMQAMEKDAEIFFNSDHNQVESWKKEKKYPSFVLFQLDILPLQENLRRERSCCLLYLAYMIEFYTMKTALLKRKDPLPSSWPQVVRKSFLERFTIVTERGKHHCYQRYMPSRLRDMLASYITVLALLINNLNLPIRHISADIKMAPKKFFNLAQTLGLTMRSEKPSEKNGFAEVEKFVILKLPLKFPKAKQFRNKRRM